MDQKIPPSKDDDERVGEDVGGESKSNRDDENKPAGKKRAAADKEEDDDLEQYREHYRAASEEAPRTSNDYMRQMHHALNPETEAEKEASIDYCARQMKKLQEIRRAHGIPPAKLKKRKVANDSPPTAASMMADLSSNMARFNREKAELEDPTIPTHNFKVGDDVKMKFENNYTLKISERAGQITEINDDGTVDIAMFEKTYGVEHPSRHNVARKVNPRIVRAFKRRKPRTTKRTNMRF